MTTTKYLKLYHASRCSFNKFDPTFYRTGEGVGDYLGWYFCSTPKGALRHCESYLRCNARLDEGFIYECLVEDVFVDSDLDGPFTEPCYDGLVSGVLLSNSSQIKILNVISTRQVFESLYVK